MIALLCVIYGRQTCTDMALFGDTRKNNSYAIS